MRTLEVKITNPNGLTSRHGADLVEEANLYKSNITMITSTSNDKADLKSIMDVMATVVNEGEAFTIRKSKAKTKIKPTTLLLSYYKPLDSNGFFICIYAYTNIR